METLRIRKIFSLFIPAVTTTELRATPFQDGSLAFGFSLSNTSNNEVYQYHVRLLSDDVNGGGIKESTSNCFEWGKRAPLQFHHDKDSGFIQGIVIKIKLQHKVFDFRKIESQSARIKVLCLDTNGNFIQEGFSNVFKVLPKRRGKEDGVADDEEMITISWSVPSQTQDYTQERYYDNSNVLNSNQRSDNSNDYSSSNHHDYSPEDESESNQMQIYSDSGSIESPPNYQMSTISRLLSNRIIRGGINSFNRNESYMVLYNGNAEVVGSFRALNFYKASDINIKENVRLLTEDRDCREAILQIDGVEYNFKPGVRAATNRRFVGYIAQQIESIVPEAVQLIDGILHVDYEALIPYLSESIRANFNDIRNVSSKADRLQKTVDMLYEQFIKREVPSRPTREEITTKSTGSTPRSKLKKVLFGSLSVLAVLVLVTAGVLLFMNYYKPDNKDDTTPTTPSPNEEDPGDEDLKIRSILTELYTATKGANWQRSDNWLRKNRLYCTWYGITCSASRIRIDLSSNSLTGTIPASLGGIELYLELILNNNMIKGTIPSFNGSSLVTLSLEGNMLFGTIPPLLGYQKSLTRLSLAHNDLNGTIPDTFVNLDSLEALDLSYNNLTGSIPTLEGSAQLVSFNASHNRLNGSIPEASQLFWLRALDLSYNKLEGTLPMLSIYLEYLNIEHNRLHGDLRMIRDFGSNISYLQISSNNFGGVLELTLEHWTNLHYLNVSSNSLTGFSHNDVDAWPEHCDATKNSFICPISNQTVVHCSATCR